MSVTSDPCCNPGRPGGRQGGLRAGSEDRRTDSGPDHPNVAIQINDLGSVLQGLGDVAGAKGLTNERSRLQGGFLAPTTRLYTPSAKTRISFLTTRQR
jgi:hypothetical protein